MNEIFDFKVIDRTSYVGTTRWGNPIIALHFTDGTRALTEPDGAIGYGIQNPEYLDVLVKVIYGAKGRVVHVKLSE